MKFNWSLTFLLFIASPVSLADYFETPLQQAKWTLNGSKTYCHLKHDIPYFGSADFVQQSGEVLRFSVEEHRSRPQIVKANLSAFPSPWVHEAINPEQYLVYLETSIDTHHYPRLVVYGDTAETMLDALLQGQYPTFSYVHAASELDLQETRVAVSAIKFIQSYEEFLNCRSRLLPYSLKHLQDSFVYFDQGRNAVSTTGKRTLEKISNYMLEDNNVSVIIGSETHIAGSADKQWFAKRAKAITSFIQQQGIDNRRISINNKLNATSDPLAIRVRIFGPDALRWIFYSKGNTRLTALEKRRLDLLARYMLEHKKYSRLIIHSHTDGKGTRSKNKTVSRKRGQVIKNYLQSKGVEDKMLMVKAHGESKPRKSNRTRRGRAQNRRVRFEFSG